MLECYLHSNAKILSGSRAPIDHNVYKGGSSNDLLLGGGGGGAQGKKKVAKMRQKQFLLGHKV